MKSSPIFDNISGLYIFTISHWMYLHSVMISLYSLYSFIARAITTLDSWSWAQSMKESQETMHAASLLTVCSQLPSLFTWAQATLEKNCETIL